MILEPELKIGSSENNFLLKMIRFYHPPKSRESRILKPELDISSSQKDIKNFLFKIVRF